MILKWSKRELLNLQGKRLAIDEQIVFADDVFKQNLRLRNLQKVHVTGDLYYDHHSDFVTCELQISGTMVLPCAITNEDVDYPFDLQVEESFAFHKVDEGEDVHETKGDTLELMPIIFQHIMLEIPLKVVKPDLKEYPKGKGWEVMSEADFEKQKNDEVDPRLAKLKEFKVEE